MKNFILALLFLSSISLATSAQTSDDELYPMRTIKTNPFRDLIGNLNVDYEQMTSDYSSFNVSTSCNFRMPFAGILNGFTYSGIDWSLYLPEKPQLFTIGTQAEYRFYSKRRKGPRGFYGAPYIGYNFMNFSFNNDYTGDIYGSYRTANSDISITANSIGVGMRIGAQWLFKNGIVIDWSFASLGFSRYFGNIKLTSDDLKSDLPKIKKDIQDSFGSVYPTFKDNVTIDGNTLKIKGGMSLPTSQTNLTIGYSF